MEAQVEHNVVRNIEAAVEELSEPEPVDLPKSVHGLVNSE
jgi:hypothetical protein